MAKKVVCKFEKVSFEEFVDACIRSHSYDNNVDTLRRIYDNIPLPTRSTNRSSGYDFYYPGEKPIHIFKGGSVIFPTGIRCVFYEEGYDLTLFPRSGMGFRYRAHLDSTVGIIDNDYFEAKNEGHIMVKLSCDPRHCDSMTINPGDRFVQGIIRELFYAEEDETEEKDSRTGGMGSTGK